MTEKEVQLSLIQIGWSAFDAKMYLKLLETGAQRASTLALHVRRPRVTVYHALERMNAKGLVIKNRTGSGWQYAATPPQQLKRHAESRFLESQKKNRSIVEYLTLLQPSLESLQRQTFHRPHVEVFEGEDALRNIYDLSLDTKSMVAYFDPWAPDKSDLQDIDHEHTMRRIEKKIPVRIILPSTKDGLAFASIRKPLKEAIVIPSDRYSFKDITIITDTRVLVFSLRDSMGVSIECANIAQNQKIQFELAWEGAKSMGTMYA